MNSIRQNPAIGGIVATVLLVGIVALISGITGPFMGLRSVPIRPPVEVMQVAFADNQVTVQLKNNAAWLIHAQYGFSVLDPAGEVLFESPSYDAGQIETRDTITMTAPFPENVTSTDWKLAAWAREVVAYPPEDAEQTTLVEPNAAVRRAPMSIVAVEFAPGEDGKYVVDAALRLTGGTLTATNVRYAISLTRTAVQENGTLVPIERAYLSSFTGLVLEPNEIRDLSLEITTPLNAGQYAVTLWVQRETAEAGVFEHFAQFTYSELLTVE